MSEPAKLQAYDHPAVDLALPSQHISNGIVKPGEDDESALIDLENGDSDTYVVLVHGIGNLQWNPQAWWKAWQSWMKKIGLGSDHTVWAYKYDIQSPNPLVFGPDGIEKEANRLLDHITRKRECQGCNGISSIHIRVSRYWGSNSEEGQHLSPAQQVSDIDIYQALSIASIEPAKYSDLEYASVGVVFINCLHRASRIEDLEDYIAALLSLNTPYPSSSVRKIQQLAQFVQDTNIAFLETKVLIRSVICNILPSQIRAAAARDDASTMKACDSDDEDSEGETSTEAPTGPTETSTNNEPPTNHLDSCYAYFGIPFELISRTKLSYLEILESRLDPDADILSDQFSGKICNRLQAALDAEIDIDHHCLVLSQAPPIYPPGAKPSKLPTDNWYNSIPEPQIYWNYLEEHGGRVHLHGKFQVPLFSQLLSERLNRSENSAQEATIYFEFDRNDHRRNDIQAMLSYFVASIISHLGHKYNLEESYGNNVEQIYSFRGWSLDDVFYLFLSLVIACDTAGLVFMIGCFDQCNETRSWFLKRINSWKTHPGGLRLIWIITSQESQDIQADLSDWLNIDLETHLPEGWPIVESLISGKDEACVPNNTSRIPSAVRPLSQEETEIIIALQSHSCQEQYDDCIGEKTVSSAVGSSFSANSKLASTCIRYLCDPGVQLRMRDFCVRNASLKRCSLTTDRQNLISYATQYWPLHYSLSGSDRPFEQAMEFFENREAKNIWSTMHYLLSNPATRIDKAYLSALPFMAMLGLDDLVEEWIKRQKDSISCDTDCGLALTTAARYGHASTARLLLEAASIKEPDLRDAIAAAASFGEGGVLEELIQRASKIEKFRAPDLLLHRVAFLGLHKITTILLESSIEVKHHGHVLESTPLHIAALLGHLETVKALLAGGADVTSRRKYNRTPLHSAAGCISVFEQPEIAQRLIEAKSDINAIDEDDMTPLQIAMTWRNLRVFELLLSKGADPNHGKEGQDDPAWVTKPLIYCSRFGMLDQVRLLLEHQVHMDCSWGGLSSLQVAIQNGHMKIAELLLRNDADPNTALKGSQMPLLLAVSNKDHSMEMTKLLLNFGARINEEASDPEWRTTALDQAAETSHPEMIEYLISKGAKLEGKGSSCPLYLAAIANKPKNVQVLIKANANVNQTPSFAEWKPIHASYKSPECLKILLENGADINALAYGKTCLHLAVEEDLPNTVQVLLKHQPNLDLEIPIDPGFGEDDGGYTALTLACHYRNYKIIKMLLNSGAKKDHPTKLGRRPLDICIRKGLSSAVRLLLQYRATIDHLDNDGNAVSHHITSDTPVSIVRQLVRAGADAHARNIESHTPLQKAVEHGNAAVVRYLLKKGADPKILVDPHTTLLHVSCRDRNLATTQALVNGGADTGWAESHGGSLLCETLFYHQPPPNQDLVQYLVEIVGISVNGKGGSHEYPVLTACAVGHDVQLQYLLEAGADPNMKDSTGRRVLHLACSRPVTKALEILLSFQPITTEDGAPVADNMGKTPIHYAASTGDWGLFHCVTGLYGEQDAEFNRPDKAGWTPFYWALMNPKTEPAIVQYLIEHGANLSARFHSLEKEWSPLKLGRFIGVSAEVLNLLVPTSHSNRPSPTGQKEHWAEEFHHSRKGFNREGSRWCDSCRLYVIGTYYTCKFCHDFDLCFRCYFSRSECHPDHESDEAWIEQGPEYAENSEEEKLPTSEAPGDDDRGVVDSNIDEDTHSDIPDELDENEELDDISDDDDDV